MSYNNITYCKTCIDIPGAHSFHIICEHNTIPVLYTKVADAKHYDDTLGILSHYMNLLWLLKEKRWIWVFDCKDLAMKHCFELQTARGICNLLKQNDNVVHILIINSNTFLNIILDSIAFFLHETIKTKIKLFTANQMPMIDDLLPGLNQTLIL